MEGALRIKNKTILVTGGAGSIGSALVEEILHFSPKSVRIFDNNEYALSNVARKLNNYRIRCLLGDIKDERRLEMATKGVDIIFHLCAIKNIDVAEYNPIEAIKTNIVGTINLIECTLRSKPKKFVFISSDKAVGFSSLYGATKFLGEKLTLWAHRIQDETIFTCVRFGNVRETRGNVFEVWRTQAREGKLLTLTDPNMKRYFMNLEDAVKVILDATKKAEGGEIFVPEMAEFRVADLIKEYGLEVKVVGKRPGEKLSEQLMTDEEKARAEKIGDLWVIKN